MMVYQTLLAPRQKWNEEEGISRVAFANSWNGEDEGSTQGHQRKTCKELRREFLALMASRSTQALLGCQSNKKKRYALCYEKTIHCKLRLKIEILTLAAMMLARLCQQHCVNDCANHRTRLDCRYLRRE